MNSKQIKYVIYVSPYEWNIIEPIKTISEYIRNKLKSRISEVSDHHIARMFPVLEDYVQGRELKLTTLAKIMSIYERHFGFSNEDERKKINIALTRLIDRLATLRSKDPVRVYKLVKSLRTLLIGFVRGRISLPISVYEKQS